MKMTRFLETLMPRDITRMKTVLHSSAGCWILVVTVCWFLLLAVLLVRHKLPSFASTNICDGSGHPSNIHVVGYCSLLCQIAQVCEPKPEVVAYRWLLLLRVNPCGPIWAILGPYCCSWRCSLLVAFVGSSHWSPPLRLAEQMLRNVRGLP